MSRRFQSLEVYGNSFDAPVALPIDRPVAVYYRQSTFAQVGNISTAIQTIDMVAELIRRGWKRDNITLIDMDEGVSGTKRIEDRDGMRRLFQLITDGAIGAVACQDEDRLFRDVTQIQVNIFIEACRAGEIQVITPSVTYVFHHPVQGDFYRRQFRFKCELAAEYINTVIKGKLNLARNRLMKEGKWGGARVPMGYMVDMRETIDGAPNPNYRKFVVFEPFAQVVREYFRLYIEANGSLIKTYQRIFDLGLFFPTLEDCPVPAGFQVNYHLAKERIPTRTAIGMMMTNPVYLGHWMFRGAIIHWNNHPPLLSEEVFFQAFNFASCYTLEGKENTRYRRVKENPRPAKEKGRDVPRPVYEGLLHLYLDDEWRKLGAWYDAKRNVYIYHTDLHSSDPTKRVWQRTATAIDEAITFYLHQKIRATFDNLVWREAAGAQLTEIEEEKRRLQLQIQSLERAMEDIVENLASLKLPALITQLEERYERMVKERAKLREQVAELDGDVATVSLSPFEEMKQAVDNWQLLTRDEQRKIVTILIKRVEIPEFVPHRDLVARIVWFDGSTDEFTVRRSVRKDQLWTLEELASLRALVNTGATQLEIARALPTRKWANIRRQIRRHCGLVSIPDNTRINQEQAFQELGELGGNESSSTPS